MYVQLGMRLLTKKFCAKKKNIEANVEHFGFLDRCNLTFSQIEIIIKFFKNFVKENLNFSQMALCERFSYRKCETFWLHFCIAYTSTIIKNKGNLYNT